MSDKKEAAEHATIVDLIRNDLSRVAEHVRVDKYRYIDVLHTNKGNILQTSSEISGKLPTDYQKHIGNILDAMLPAGSITGAPKDKTMEIIHEAEGYDRGFYTGIMGIYNNGELNSAVMIRFLENEGQGTYFKAYRQGFFLPCHSRRKFLAVSYFYISRSLQDTPLLKFSLDGLEITLEDHIVHDPAIEEALRYNP